MLLVRYHVRYFIIRVYSLYKDQRYHETQHSLGLEMNLEKYHNEKMKLKKRKRNTASTNKTQILNSKQLLLDMNVTM